MNDVTLQLQTDHVLLEKLQSAALRKPSARELLEQRVSYVYGSLDTDNQVTREQIRKLIIEQEGCE